MNTFIFLGCVPAPEWQNRINFVTKLYLTKKILIFWYEKKKYTPPSKDTTWGFWSEKSGSPGGEFAVTCIPVYKCTSESPVAN